MPAQARIEIGYVARSQGLHGEVRVRLYNEQSTLLDEVDSVRAEGPDGAPPRILQIESVRGGGKGLIVGFEGIADREAADRLVGAKLWVDRAQLPALEDGEYYHFELIGLKVIDEQGRALGTLEEVYDLPSNDVYVVRGKVVGELMVPALENFIGAIDMEARTLTLKNVDELLEP